MKILTAPPALRANRQSARCSTDCKLGLEGIVSKRKGSPYRSGRSPDWLKVKNPDAPAVKREAEEDWNCG
jgi:ATP-dependent DNA ligase